MHGFVAVTCLIKATELIVSDSFRWIRRPLPKQLNSLKDASAIKLGLKCWSGRLGLGLCPARIPVVLDPVCKESHDGSLFFENWQVLPYGDHYAKLTRSWDLDPKQVSNRSTIWRRQHVQAPRIRAANVVAQRGNRLNKEKAIDAPLRDMTSPSLKSVLEKNNTGAGCNPCV